VPHGTTPPTLPVPFRCPASRGKEAPALQLAFYTDCKYLCAGCGERRYILSSVGFNVNNLCFFCTAATGREIGHDKSSKLKQNRQYEEKAEPSRGRLQLAFPSPAFLRTTAENSPETDKAALLGRALANTPKVENRDVSDVFASLCNVPKILFPGIYEHQLEWKGFDDWLQHCGISSGNKRAIREQHEWYDGLDNDARALVWESMAKAFVKLDNEKLGFRARLIQGMEPLITAITGPFIASIQEFFEKLALPKQIFFAAGKTMADFRAWRRKIPPWFKCVSVDMTNYDSNMKNVYIDMVLKVYSLIMRLQQYDNKAFMALVLHHQKYTMQGQTKYFKYKVVGTMKSGASDTCLANSIVNYLVILHAMSRCTGRSPEELIKKKLIRMAIMGDDNLCFVPSSFDTRRLEKELQNMGMQPKVSDEEIFLNLVPHWNGDDPVPSLLSGRLLGRLFHTIAPYHKVNEVRGHLAGVFICLYPSIHHDPILQPLFSRLWELTKYDSKGVTAQVEASLNVRFKMLSRERVEPTPSLTRSYCRRYDLDEQDLASWRKWCSKAELGSVLSHPVAMKAMERDLGVCPAA